MTRMDVIVNADDLGMSAKVNDAIFQLIAAGRISSATILANGPAMKEAAAQLHRFPQCSFGIHLNLTQFQPLTGGATASVLTNGTGELSRDIETAFPTMALLRAAYKECCAQVDALAAAGVNISHFDSHNHVHTRPHIFPVLKAVQKRYRTRRVRIAKNLYSSTQPASASLRWKKRAYNAALRSLYHTQTTDVFTEFLTFVEVWQQRKPECRSVELMVHPGASYASEEESLLGSDWVGRLGPAVRLIDYRQIGS
jgi:chitin disaccharide deacetylase